MSVGGREHHRERDRERKRFRLNVISRTVHYLLIMTTEDSKNAEGERKLFPASASSVFLCGLINELLTHLGVCRVKSPPPHLVVRYRPNVSRH